jgi:hypothetical protein
VKKKNRFHRKYEGNYQTRRVKISNYIRRRRTCAQQARKTAENGLNQRFGKYENSKLTPRYNQTTRKIGIKIYKTKVSNSKFHGIKYSEPIIFYQKETERRKKNKINSELINVRHKNKVLKKNDPKYTEPIKCDHTNNKKSNNQARYSELINLRQTSRNRSEKGKEFSETNLTRQNQNINQFNHSYCKQRILISNDVETNPGPNKINNQLLEQTSQESHIIFSYNVQGCKDYKKLKRLINFFHRQKCSKRQLLIYRRHI